MKINEYRHGLNMEIKPDIEISEILNKEIEKEKIEITDDKIISLKLNKELENKEIIINVKENSKLIIETSGTENNKISMIEFIINVNPNINLELIQIENSSKKSNILINRIINQKENTNLKITDIVLGGDYIKYETITNLLESKAKMTQELIHLSKNKQKQDIYTMANHTFSETFSDISTRGVTRDSSKVLSRSLIKIIEGARNSIGHEKQEVIILGETAEASTIPNLEIDNDEVECSHKSTIGMIDEEILFYMMSRGLNKEKAEQKIIEGYFIPIIKNINDENIENLIKREIEK